MYGSGSSSTGSANSFPSVGNVATGTVTDGGGDWGPNPADSFPDPSYTGSANVGNTNATPGTVSNRILGNTTGTAQQPAAPQGGGFWQAFAPALTTAAQMLTAKQAQQNGLRVTGYTQGGQPIYAPASTLSTTLATPLKSMNTGSVLLVGGLVVAALALSRKG